MTRKSLLHTGIIAAVSVAFGIIMILPQLFAILDFGWGSYFDSAPDMSFYMMNLTGEGGAWNSRQLHVLNDALWTLTGESPQAYLIVATFLFAVLAFWGAWLVATAVTNRPLLITALIPLLLFPVEWLGFNMHIGLLKGHGMHSLVAGLPLEWRSMISDNYINFLSISRLPEPATSWWLFLVFAGMLLRTVLNSSPPRAIKGMTLVAGCTLVLGYPFLSVAGIFVAGSALAASLVSRQSAKVRFLLFLMALMLSVFIATVLGTHRTEAGAFLFSSRLPMFSPAHGWSLFLGGLAIVLRTRFADPFRFWLVVALLCVPVVAMNQQVMTGIMIQALNWERYLNYACIALAIALMAGMLPSILDLPRHAALWLDRLRPAISSAVAAGWMVLMLAAQIDSYRQWWTYNAQNLAMVSALKDVYAAEPGLPRKVFLDDMSRDQLIRPRVTALGLGIDGYTTVVKSMVTVEQERLPVLGFEYARASGLSPDALQERLDNEVLAGVCWPFTMYFHRFLQCAPYMSDFRKYDRTALLARNAKVVTAYRQHLSTECGLGPHLFLALNQNEGFASGPPHRIVLSARYPFQSTLFSLEYLAHIRIQYRPDGWCQ